jgi:hypothetical protein
MAKIIIPRSELPNLSQEQTNRFRFRVINKNRNLASEWSTVGQIKRPVDDINYSLANTFSAEAIQKAVMISWEKSNNISQTYDVYMKEYQRTFISTGGGFYSYNSSPLSLSESTTRNSAVVYGVYSGAVGVAPPSPQGAQIMVRNFQYPRLSKYQWPVLQCERKANVIKIYLSPNITDFDDSYNANGTVYVDTTIQAASGSYYTSFASMELFNIVETYTVNKTNPSYTILQRASVGTDVSLFVPQTGIAVRVDPDPLFISSSYVNYA